MPASGTATYYLTDDGKVSRAGDGPARGLKLTKTDKDIAIDTGAASFVIPMQGGALISKASIGGAEVLGPAGLCPTITSGDWPDRGMKDGDKQAGSHDAAGVTVEESGLARVVVAIKGVFTPGDKDRRFYDYTARLYFTAASPAVRIVYTISNDKLDSAFYPLPDGKSKSRLAYVWPIKDASLVGDLSLNGKPTAGTLVEDKLLTQAIDAEPMKILQSAATAFKVTLGDKELGAGKQNLGVLDLTDGGAAKAGLTVAKRYFREEWPGAISASAKELRIGLLPAESKGTFQLNHGAQKSWDIRLTLHGGTPATAADLSNRFNEHDALLLFRPDPAWMVWAAGETGSWPAGLALSKTPTRKGAGVRRAPGKTDSPSRPGHGGWEPDGGWDLFGQISNWHAGGTHWNEQTAFFNWVIFGNGAELDYSEIPTLWAADQCPIHFDRPDMDAFWPYVGHGSLEHCRLKVLTFPGYDPKKAPTDKPDTGHMGMWMWSEYYMLTGDARCREAVCMLGAMARGHLWQFTHEEKKDGTGALTGGQFHPFHKFNPDAEPDFKLDTRYIGWPLFCLSQGYQFTGDPAALKDAKIVAGGFRNTARACPIGMLTKDAAGVNGTEPTEYSGNIITRDKEGKVQVKQGNVLSHVRESVRSASLICSNFYHGLVLYGLREYYLMSRDVEALDAMVGQIDRFCHQTLIRDAEGKMLGWTYEFGDYWGPYTADDAVSSQTKKLMTSLAYTQQPVVDVLGGIYVLTGRADLLEVLKASAADDGNTGERGNLVIALQMATLHPKVHATPPAAIKDLAVEPQGGGKVKLTWTAPAGAAAAWYQVKYTPAEKLVERIAGWPDRTEPLPQSRKDWLDRAAAFNARQRSFWAAINLPGAPKPGAAGGKESMVVEGLPAGKLNFGIKSWDAFDNMSELSNVVQAEVK